MNTRVIMKMILVFHAFLAPRGYGRTSPRSPRVYLPFVANLAQLAAPRHFKSPHRETQPGHYPTFVDVALASAPTPPN